MSEGLDEFCVGFERAPEQIPEQPIHHGAKQRDINVRPRVGKLMQ
jgi:hypothetical protein